MRGPYAFFFELSLRWLEVSGKMKPLGRMDMGEGNEYLYSLKLFSETGNLLFLPARAYLMIPGRMVQLSTGTDSTCGCLRLSPRVQ